MDKLCFNCRHWTPCVNEWKKPRRLFDYGRCACLNEESPRFWTPNYYKEHQWPVLDIALDYAEDCGVKLVETPISFYCILHEICEFEELKRRWNMQVNGRL